MDLEQVSQPLSCLLGYNGELVPDAQDQGKGDKQLDITVSRSTG